MQEFLKNINLYDSGGNSGKKISIKRSATVTAQFRHHVFTFLLTTISAVHF
jgi:hypothetical protein